MTTPNFAKQFLSGTTSGEAIVLTATAIGSAQTIHTATSTTNEMDEVFIYLNNINASAVTAYLLWGGTTVSYLKRYELAAGGGDFLAVAGCPLGGGLIVKAYADVANAITLTGYIHRMNFL